MVATERKVIIITTAHLWRVVGGSWQGPFASKAGAVAAAKAKLGSRYRPDAVEYGWASNVQRRVSSVI